MLKPILFIILFQLTLATITPEHFAGVFTLQHGECARNLSILVNSTTIPATAIRVSNQTCTGDQLELFKPSSKGGVSSFVTFLLSASSVGDFYTTNIKNLTCGNYTYSNQLFILRPEDDLTISKEVASFFPKLNQSLPNGVVLSDDYIYIFVNSCIYKRKAPEETGIIDNIINSITECLPADAMVHTDTGKVVVESLNTGATVLSPSGTHTKIIGWTHRDGFARAKFLQISFGNSSIAVTPGHYVYADGGTIAAKRVKKGMVMRGLYGGLVVQNVQTVWKRGLYNPQTGNGDIVVNDVVVSTYTEAIPPVVAHALLAPVRLGFDLFSGIAEIFEGIEVY